ncbi:AMP-dependent synthetase/ligase [Macrophomina phaseolina MS6]|uniref:AMP-dependent synthetase/ligase n=1 Tax=Macrophomina phaseolina (strain MS6) TaxID=1126212 RepID=K2RFE4_MACPH|nr:AMP-dependent synthetase/ligase [Macrophomina phaseolina MS6]
MADSPILVSFPGPYVVKITLNRPSALNAINADLLDGLTSALRSHQDARVILLEGAGDRSFCAGEDLKQTLAPRTGSAKELREAFSKLQDITRLTSSSQAVVVVSVQGFAIGGGAEIALAADFLIGGPNAKFRFPEVTLGHAVTGGISLRLTQLVGLLKAKELLITGRWVDAGEALKLGMLSEVAEDPKRRAEELAVQLAALPAIAMASSKMQLERVVFPNLEACLQDEVNVASYCFAQSDADQAFANFATRKAPASKKTTLGVTTADGVSDETRDRPIRDINSALEYAVTAFPNRTFLRMSGADISFSQCNEAIRKLAGGLQRAGVQCNDRVLVMMRNSVEMVYSWLAANRLGAVYVPVNVELKSITLRRVVEAANPKMAVVDAEMLPELQALGVVHSDSIYVKGGDGASVNAFSRLMDAGEAIDTHVKVMPATTAALLYTSGTSGRSKPCVLSHEYFILQAKGLMEGCLLRQDDVLYCPFPLFHADATALTVVPAILLGAVAALSARFSPSKFWEIRGMGATVYDFMGATLALTYKQPPSPRDCDHKVRLAWGVPIPHFAKDYEERFGHPLVTLYGSVEAGLPIIQQGELPYGSCGRLRRGFQLRIANDMDEEVPPNTLGHLLLRSDQPNGFFDGYFNDAFSTASAFRSLWLHTGDLAKVDEAGNVYFLGRAKDVIRRRGENVNASEVEEEFLQHPDVVIAAAYGIPSQFGEGTEEDIKVVVQLREGSVIDERGLWEWARAHMAWFQVPDVLERVEEIRGTPTGKIEKYGLRVEGGVRFDRK